MSSPYFADRRPDRGHPDRGELADEIAGVAAPAVAEHLVDCRDCSARLAALSTASLSVTQYLRADPEPELPAAVAARFAEAIAAESARPANSPGATSTPAAAPIRPPVPSTRRREGWWARHTRLGGVLVTAASLVVVGGGGSLVATWVRDGNSTNQASFGRTSATQEDSGAPGNDLSSRPTPLGAMAGTIALHRSTFAGEITDVLGAGTRTAGELTSAQATCATDTLADTDLDGAALSAVSGAFTLDGTRVLVVVAGHDGTRTAVAISGCSSGKERVAARGDLP